MDISELTSFFFSKAFHGHGWLQAFCGVQFGCFPCFLTFSACLRGIVNGVQGPMYISFSVIVFTVDILKHFLLQLFSLICNSHRVESNSGFTHEGSGADARINAPNLCSNAKTSVPPPTTIRPCAVNVQVQPDDSCQEDIKN